MKGISKRSTAGWLVVAIAAVYAFAAPGPLRAETVSSPFSNTDLLPEAPGYGNSLQAAGIVTGKVTNPAGSGVLGVTVTLSGSTLTAPLTTQTGQSGRYIFRGLPAGSYTVKVAASGYIGSSAPTVSLATGERYKLPITIIPIPHASTTVRVTATPIEIATAQVKLEEKQRVLGIIPNFSTSYSWNAAPLTTGLKYNLAFHVITDPYTFAVAAGVAGVEQADDYYPGYGKGLQGYGKRFGVSYADSAVARMMGGAVYASWFHQDPRYFYRGTGSTGSRLWYAIRSAFVTRGDDGHEQPNYSRVLGDFTAAGVSNLYLSPQDRSARITFQNGLIVLAGDALENVMREFLTKGLTSHIPPGANGKP